MKRKLSQQTKAPRPIEQLKFTRQASQARIKLKVTGLPGSIEVAMLRPIALQPALDPLPQEYDGNYDRNADQLEVNAKERFIAADKLYFARTRGQHLQIHSGRRTVRRQAELWICWKRGTPGCNPANLPGCSLHNYGVAIDVVRVNETLINEALGSNGWVQTVPDEGWHFECTASDAHARSAAQINAFRNGKAGEWANLWQEIQKLIEKRNALAQDYVALRDKLAASIRDYNGRVANHNSQVQEFDRRAAQWKSDRDVLQGRINDFNRRVAEANALAQEINQMPPGPARDAAYQRWLTVKNQLDQERPQLQRAVDELEQRRQALIQQGQELKRQKEKLDQEKAVLLKEVEQVRQLEEQIKALEQDIATKEKRWNELLTEIEAVIGSSHLLARRKA